MKRMYNAPELEVIMLENADIITTSPTGTIGGDSFGSEIELPEV